jgi:hypothetical protein
VDTKRKRSRDVKRVVVFFMMRNYGINEGQVLGRF